MLVSYVYLEDFNNLILAVSKADGLLWDPVRIFDLVNSLRASPPPKNYPKKILDTIPHPKKLIPQPKNSLTWFHPTYRHISNSYRPLYNRWLTQPPNHQTTRTTLTLFVIWWENPFILEMIYVYVVLELSMICRYLCRMIYIVMKKMPKTS